MLGQDFTILFMLDRSTILLLVLSVIFSITLGNFVYLTEQYHVGISRAAPIMNLTLLITLFAVFILLGACFRNGFDSLWDMSRVLALDI